MYLPSLELLLLTHFCIYNHLQMMLHLIEYSTINGPGLDTIIAMYSHDNVPLEVFIPLIITDESGLLR